MSSGLKSCLGVRIDRCDTPPPAAYNGAESGRSKRLSDTSGMLPSRRQARSRTRTPRSTQIRTELPRDEVCLRHHDLHPPEEVRVFAAPESGLQRWDEKAVVYEMQVNGLVLRHYSFYDRWFAVNCTLYPDGGFATEPGPIDWCFNCDATSPLFSVGRDLYNVDLFLDVLVGPDGRTHITKDEHDLASAIENGWLLVEEQAGARRGLEQLVEIIEGPGLVAFLEQVCPFRGAAGSVPPPMMKLTLAEAPLLHPDTRSTYFGRRL